MSKRRNAKAVEKEAKREIQQVKSLYGNLLSMVNSERVGMSPQQMYALAKSLKVKSQNSIDVGYIKTLLFPELYSYDIPQPLSNISYCRFTDKQEATINTGNDGSNGSGVILWYPKTNYGPSLFFFPCTTATLDASFPPPLASGVLDQTKWKVGMIQQYDSYFSQTCLVAASISLQYTGQIQTESGYFVGGSTFASGINTISVDDIENAQFRVLAKPGEGIRLVYLPKDSNDFTYYPLKAGTAHNNGSTGANEDTFIMSKSFQYNCVNPWFDPVSQTSKIIYANTATDVTYTNNTPCLAIYWKGLPANQNVLRIDTTRKFNAIPKTVIRDIVDVSRPKRQYDSKKTTDVVSQLILSVPQLGGHTIKEMDYVSDEIQQYLPNVGHLYQTGALKSGMGLSGLSKGLALQQEGLSGPISNPGRIWDTD